MFHLLTEGHSLPLAFLVTAVKGSSSSITVCKGSNACRLPPNFARLLMSHETT
jgi:hypothetical protein